MTFNYLIAYSHQHNALREISSYIKTVYKVIALKEILNHNSQRNS